MVWGGVVGVANRGIGSLADLFGGRVDFAVTRQVVITKKSIRRRS